MKKFIALMIASLFVIPPVSADAWSDWQEQRRQERMELKQLMNSGLPLPLPSTTSGPEYDPMDSYWRMREDWHRRDQNQILRDIRDRY